MDKLKWDAPELAERYDVVSDSQYERGLVLMDKLCFFDGCVVLDIGCGTGRMALHVSSLAGPAGRVFGIDPSPHRIRVADQKLRGSGVHNVVFMQGHGEDLGAFPDGSFDVVYLCSVFHWINDKKTTLAGIYRVLKPGGKVGMTTGDKHNPSLTKAVTREVLARPRYAGKVNAADDASQPVDKAELEALLSAAGFEEVNVECRAAKRHFDTTEAVLKFSEASSFGTFLKHVSEDVRGDARRDVEAGLEKRRTAAGIEFYTHTLYATAAKPR